MFRKFLLLCTAMASVGLVNTAYAQQTPTAKASNACLNASLNDAQRRFGKQAYTTMNTSVSPMQNGLIQVNGRGTLSGAPANGTASFTCVYNSLTGEIPRFSQNLPQQPVRPPAPPATSNLPSLCQSYVTQKMRYQYGNSAQLRTSGMTSQKGPQGMIHFEGKGTLFYSANPRSQNLTAPVNFSCNAQNGKIIKADYTVAKPPVKPQPR